MKMTETFKNYCVRTEIKPEKVDDNVYRIGFGGKHACLESFVTIDEEDGEIIMETILPVKVSPEKRATGAEIVVRLNSKFRNGFIDLSMNSGYLTYKTNFLLGKSELQNDMVKHLIFSNWISADGSFSVINAVLFGNISPQDAIDDLTRQKNTQNLLKAKDPTPKSSDISEALARRMGGFTNN